MNGRVYDPVVGRFLSADPIVDWSLGTQGVNPYGYVGNRPLSLTDPNGYDSQDECAEIPGAEGDCLDGVLVRCRGSTGPCQDDYLFRNRNAQAELMRYLLRGGSTQASSMAERDPCGQDGSQQACEMANGTYDVGGVVFDAPILGGIGGDVPEPGDSEPTTEAPRVSMTQMCPQAGADMVLRGVFDVGALGSLAGAAIMANYAIAELPHALTIAASARGFYGVIIAAGAFSDVGGFAIVGMVAGGAVGAAVGVVAVGTAVYLYNQYQIHYGSCSAP